MFSKHLRQQITSLISGGNGPEMIAFLEAWKDEISDIDRLEAPNTEEMGQLAVGKKAMIKELKMLLREMKKELNVPSKKEPTKLT